MPVADAEAGVAGLLVPPGLVGVDRFGVEADDERPEMPPKSWSQPDMLLPKAGLPPAEGVRLTPPEAPVLPEDVAEEPSGRAAPVGVDAPPGPDRSALLLPGRNAEACGLSFDAAEEEDEAAAVPVGGLIDLLTAASIEARIRASADMALLLEVEAAELDAAPPLAFLLFADAFDADAAARPPAFLPPSVTVDLPFRAPLPLASWSSPNASSLSRPAASSKSSSSEAASTISSSSSLPSLKSNAFLPPFLPRPY